MVNYPRSKTDIEQNTQDFWELVKYIIKVL